MYLKEILPQNEGFYFLFGNLGDFVPEDPDFFVREKSLLFKILPGKLAHKKLLAEMDEIVFHQVERNCGRLRADFVERIHKTAHNFKTKLVEALEEVIGGINKALTHAQRQKANSAGEAEKTAGRLREQETAVRYVLEGLEFILEQARGMAE